MQDWCRALHSGDCWLAKIIHPNYPDHFTYVTDGAQRKAKPTWAMADKLVDAGLIEWLQTSKPLEFAAALTPSGIAQAQIEVEAPQAKLTSWPFPVSAHV